MPDPSNTNFPSPEKDRGRGEPGGGSLESFTLATAGSRLGGVQLLQCTEMIATDWRFIVAAVSESALDDEAFEEVWRFLTSNPHDGRFAWAPTDEELSRIAANRDQSWDLGRRVSNGVVEYYAILRVEQGPWAGITLGASHLENFMSPDRVLFSASVDPRSTRGVLPRDERISRLCRLCGLTEFSPARNGADFVARSTTLEGAEFSVFLIGPGQRAIFGDGAS